MTGSSTPRERPPDDVAGMIATDIPAPTVSHPIMAPPVTLEADDDREIVEIRTTFSCRERADACAARLIGDRVAACVQVEGPLRSTYRWQGVVENSEEWRCVCKTTPAREAACLRAITAGHEYQLPEAVVTRCRGTPEYAAWVRGSVTE